VDHNDYTWHPIHALTFAHNCCEKSSQENCNSALSKGRFLNCRVYGMKDIDPDFMEKNNNILSQKRGAGYWLWKAYLIDKMLNDPSIPDGEFIFYSDAGSKIIQDGKYFIDTLIVLKQHFLLFEVGHPAKEYTKRDTFILMDCDYPSCYEANQANAAFLLFQKGTESRDFVKKWLLFAQDYRIITDANNTQGKPNLPEFKDHRHDQSILGILAFKLNITLHRDPSQWGNNKISSMKSNSPYPQMIEHTRKKE